MNQSVLAGAEQSASNGNEFSNMILGPIVEDPADLGRGRF
jgi:hypothetical protein